MQPNAIKSSSFYVPSPLPNTSHLRKSPIPSNKITCVSLSTFTAEVFNTMKSKEFHIELFKSAASVIGQVFNSMSTLSSVHDQYKEGDLVELLRNGVSTLAYVEKVTFFETTFRTHVTEFKVQNTKIDTTTISNLTPRCGSSKYYAIQAEFDTGSHNPRELFDDIETAIHKNDYVKEHTHDNTIVLLPKKKISVCCYVPLTKLGVSPFKAYLKARLEVISEIEDVIDSGSPLFGFLRFFARSK
ncbi:uncharacterized protein LOC113355611 [Papaver somniferum]|uniref:uncharacterized protein LOC113355611 n=1 Tax=Papaver somniferum TaxID=3469 RepID=UPI000E6FA950|nr:uncharacterized protein LOC113355611 [Papaver somniferum]